MPLYAQIADKVAQLTALGMSYRAVADALGVTDKTVRRAMHAALQTELTDHGASTNQGPPPAMARLLDDVDDD